MVYQKSPVLVSTILREGYTALLTEKRTGQKQEYSTLNSETRDVEKAVRNVTEPPSGFTLKPDTPDEE